MTYMGRIVEGAMAALAFTLVSGCAAVPVASGGERPAGEDLWPAPPAGVDYATAVRCAALLDAFDILSGDAPDPFHAASIFERWAKVRAAEASKGPGEAQADIEASRSSFLKIAGDSVAFERREKLTAEHGADLQLCKEYNAGQRVIITGADS